MISKILDEVSFNNLSAAYLLKTYVVPIAHTAGVRVFLSAKKGFFPIFM